MGPNLTNCSSCMCPKRPNYLLLYLNVKINLHDMISSETLITFILRKPLKQSRPGVKPKLVKFISYPVDFPICVITTLRMYL